MKANKILQDIYLDWWNNYISIEKYAEHNDLTMDQARELILISRDVHNYLAENNIKNHNV